MHSNLKLWYTKQITKQAYNVKYTTVYHMFVNIERQLLC